MEAEFSEAHQAFIIIPDNYNEQQFLEDNLTFLQDIDYFVQYMMDYDTKKDQKDELEKMLEISYDEYLQGITSYISTIKQVVEDYKILNGKGDNNA